MPSVADRLRGALTRQALRRFAPDELALAISLLHEPDPRLQRLIGDALIRTGEPALPAVIAALTDSDAAVRRAASFVLGKLLHQTSNPAGVQALCQVLGDQDPKVRKNAAVALGSLTDQAAVPALITQLQAEQTHYVRPSIILALGAIGGQLAQAALQGFTAQTDDDRRALHLALDRSTTQPPPMVLPDILIDAQIDLLCRPGLEPLLQRELAADGVRPGATGSGFVRLGWHGPLAGLLRWRCFDTLSLPIERLPADPLSQPGATAAAFADSPVLMCLPQLTEHAPAEQVRYRVTLELPANSHVRKRAWIDTFVAAFDQRTTGLLNSPGQYSWEFLVRQHAGHWYCGIRPTALHDPRFAYRVQDVPAALNPAVAAAMVRLLPAHPGDIVLDPFCGSGTPLVERGRLAPYQRLIGVDTQPEALDVARTNLTAAKLQHYELLRGDATRLQELLHRTRHAQVDMIITNPPYGVRVGSASQVQQLYPAFFKQAALVLKPEGRVAMLARDGKLAMQAARQHGFTVERQYRVDTGGILVWLLVFRVHNEASFTKGE